MIKFTKGDIFETPADIRVNTVNCVGVMGAGLALAFKNKYPEMFQRYQKDCRAGKVKPGKLHIWKKEILGVWIINFPTKRHWREPSRYEDIEAGLIALHDYLLEETKENSNLRVALPAVGCGHGGLDWNRISQMIEEHLSDLEAEIIVFEPSASRNAGIKVNNGEDGKSLEKLQSLGIAIIGPGHEKYPEALRGKSAATFYVKGDIHILYRPVLALLPSSKPSKREIDAATACIEDIAQPGVTLLVGYGPAIERPSIRIALQQGADVALLISEGIINFRVRRDVQDIWDENRILVLSAAKPNQSWSPSSAFRAKDLQLTMAKAALITDPSPDWLSRLLKKQVPTQLPNLFYVKYDTDDFPSKSIFRNIRANPIGRSSKSGKPNVAPIIECLGIIRAPEIMETESSLTEAYGDESQIAERVRQVYEAPAKQTIAEEQKGSDSILRYPKRLIEVDLPIKRISAHARREKSIRHGHISTLHIWWARRPLAACRAVICAALWPDPADDLCPHEFREKASQIIMDFAKKATSNKELAKTCDPKIWAKWQILVIGGNGLDPNNPSHMNVLRFSLLDFIADFANWDNSTVKEYLETARALTQAAHEALGGQPDTRPLVVDPFAGGGSIPLEALRVGADVFASDLNPVAVLLNKVVLEYIPRHGQRLADEVRKWGKWVKEQAEKELADYFPIEDPSSPPVAYLWARTIRCEGPGCGAEVPLIRSLWLAKTRNRSVALRLIPDATKKAISFEIINDTSRAGNGTVKRGSVTCPVCDYTTPVKRVREQMKQASGGADTSRLVAVVHRSNSEKTYQVPSNAALKAVERAKYALNRDEVIPPIKLPIMSGVFNAPIYGISQWDLLFSSRQLLAARVISEAIDIAFEKLCVSSSSGDLAIALKVLLLFAHDKYLDFHSTLCGWIPVGEKIGHTFGRQALGMIFDWVEGTPFGDMSGSWERSVEYIAKFLEAEAKCASHEGTVEQSIAQSHPLPDDSVQAFISDPPYYNAVPYADLSDFFYIWLRKGLNEEFPALFGESVAPKADEICEMSGWDPIRYPHKDAAFYETGMKTALSEGRRLCAPSGIGVVVFAHKTTTGWESLLAALIDSGWIVTGSWPIDTERSGRLRAMNSAALASSIHLVCRPRENPNGSLRTDYIGDWRDVFQELPNRIHDWMPRLANEGVVGADAIFACLGPALEIFSRYSSVEKASGEQVTLKEYLEHVWAAVSKEALNMIFKEADATGFEEDARLTAMWLWTISTGENGKNDKNGEGENRLSTGYVLEYDAARKIAQGLGAHMERFTNLVEIKGETARLLPVSERTKYLFGKGTPQSTKGRRKKEDKQMKLGFLEEFEEADEQGAFDEALTPSAGKTVLDHLHQSMILFAAGRGEALKRSLVEEGIGRDQRFWRLAQALSALYPANVDEKRWVDGVLARKKGLGF